jgi:hypothetical protein
MRTETTNHCIVGIFSDWNLENTTNGVFGAKRKGHIFAPLS